MSISIVKMKFSSFVNYLDSQYVNTNVNYRVKNMNIKITFFVNLTHAENEEKI